MTAVLALVAAYLVGAIPTGYLVARAFGVGDIRRHGSGNIGATNVLRTLGPLPAILTLVGDVGKGYAAVAVATLVAQGDATVTAGGTVAAVVGNCWSVFLAFKGGKGVATGLGAMLRLAPWATVAAAAAWVAIAATFRYASLASLTAVVATPIGAALLGSGAPAVVATLAVAVIIVARHRDNIARLAAGTERRLGQRSASA